MSILPFSPFLFVNSWLWLFAITNLVDRRVATPEEKAGLSSDETVAKQLQMNKEQAKLKEEIADLKKKLEKSKEE